MDLPTLQRRKFLSMGVSGMAAFAIGGLPKYKIAQAAEPATVPFFSLNAIGALQAPDENGVMLPPGFRSRIVASSGEPPVSNSAYSWHSAPDGGACYASDDGGWIYVSNSEMRNNGGGVGALRFDANGVVIDAYSILGNTSINCAGGATPWQTWLSCEEFSVGQVYECDPFGVEPAIVRPALGSFIHEAVAVDTLNGCLYLTEDAPDGGLYRFRPQRNLPDLTAGVLEIAAITETNSGLYVSWHVVPDPSAKTDPTRHQVAQSYSFRGAEGIAIFDNKAYFSTKRDNRVWSYDVQSNQIEVIYDVATSSNPILSGVDNITITPAGDVLVAEDGGNLQIVVLTPDDRVIPLLQLVGHDESEITGPAFDPSHQRLYFSSQRGTSGASAGGISFEISSA
jgi:secreted PhoX family phosphatase